MAKISEFRPGPLSSASDKEKAIIELVAKLNEVIQQLNELLPEE